jgi:acyl-CoA dehydrogenase
MDFNDTPEEAAFRAQARVWLAANAPAHVLPEGDRLEDTDEMARGRAWQRALYDGGYAGITLSRALGGRGGTIIEQVVFAEEESRYALPKGPYISIGLGMALTVIGKHGTSEQIARFCEATLKGEITWCQLFSEPSAGSDLANLRTKAVPDGDHWVVNGQKVWSSWAHLAEWGILVVRTDPTVPKHKGLSFFVVDMKAPGVEVRPIRQISGASDFNETFLTDVRIPDTNRIGAVGDGWACCMTVLMSERIGSGSERESVAAMITYAGNTPRGPGTALDSSAVRVAMAQALAEERGEKYLQARLRTMISRGENPGALASMIKLAYASRNQKSLGLGMELRGLDALATGPADEATAKLQYEYIWSTVMRIAGGADEVLRNQIAERVLGMPGEIRTDKNVPFDQL